MSIEIGEDRPEDDDMRPLPVRRPLTMDDIPMTSERYTSDEEYGRAEISQAEEPVEYRLTRAYLHGYNKGFNEGRNAGRLDR